MLFRLVGRLFGRRTARDSRERGLALEARVARLFRWQLKPLVRQNVRIRDRNGNWSEIDVRYGIFFRRYVECKAYHRDHLVPLDDVAKFAEVLRMNRVWRRQGLFVTTSTFSPRCPFVGIRLIDGAQLARMERRAPFVGLAKALVYIALLVLCAREVAERGRDVHDWPSAEQALRQASRDYRAQVDRGVQRVRRSEWLRQVQTWWESLWK